MKSPNEKYMFDPEYRQLVDMMENMIVRCQFTPSEIREASVLASINYEMRRVRGHYIDPRVSDALDTLDQFSGRNQGDKR